MPDSGSWQTFYQSDLQSVWGLWGVPVLFGSFLLVRRLARPEHEMGDAARKVDRYGQGGEERDRPGPASGR